VAKAAAVVLSARLLSAAEATTFGTCRRRCWNGGTRLEAKTDTLVEVARRIVVPDVHAKANAAPCRLGHQCAQQPSSHALAEGSLTSMVTSGVRPST